MSWNKRSQKLSIISLKFLHKFVYIPVSEHFSFAKIVHPPDRCGTSRSWLNSVIITQLVLGTIKGHSKICSFVTQLNATDVSRFEGAWNWHADCNCRGVARECDVHFPTINHLQCCFREFVSTSNCPYNRRPREVSEAHCEADFFYLSVTNRFFIYILPPVGTVTRIN